MGAVRGRKAGRQRWQSGVVSGASPPGADPAPDLTLVWALDKLLSLFGPVSLCIKWG